MAVQLLVVAQWLSGRLAAVDGHGVVLHSDDLEHAVVRMERVAAVRICSALPGRTPIAQAAHPMPSPRQPAEA